MRYWTSDLHFGHAAMLRADYCGRPWATVDDMNAGLVARWNHVVTPDDDVMVLGDLTLKNPAPNGVPAAWLADLLGAMHGTKTLVIGNHDRMWQAEMRYRRTGDNTAGERLRDLYRQLGLFVMVSGYGHRRVDGEQVRWAYSHLPMTRSGHEQVDEAGYAATVPHDGDGSYWRLHGHVHDAWQQHGRQINVGVDAWNGQPVPDSVIDRMIADGPCNMPAQPWIEDAAFGRMIRL